MPLTIKDVKSRLQQILRANDIQAAEHQWLLEVAKSAPKVKAESHHGQLSRVYIDRSDKSDFASPCFRVQFNDGFSCSISIDNLARGHVLSESAAAAYRAKNAELGLLREIANEETLAYRRRAPLRCARAGEEGCDGELEVDHVEGFEFCRLVQAWKESNGVGMKSWRAFHAQNCKLQYLCAQHHREKTKAFNSAQRGV